MKQILIRKNAPLPLEYGSKPKRLSREWFMFDALRDRVIKQHRDKQKRRKT